MFVAVSIFVGQGMPREPSLALGGSPALRRVLTSEDRFAPIGGVTFLFGIVFGFLTAITGDFALSRPGC